MNKNNLTTLEDFQKYIDENNIKSKKEFRETNKYLYDKYIRLIPKEQRFLKFEIEGRSFYENKYNSINDFQIFIDENNISRPVEFKRNFPKIYDRFCRIIPKNDKNLLVYTNKINSYKNIITIEDLQLFIESNNIHSRKELHKKFPGLYIKFSRNLDSIYFCKNNFSLGENYLIDLFNKHNIKYITQKTYPDLKMKLLLRFDFYLPEYNILIEHQGEGHFGKGKFASEELNYSDKLKYQYAKNNKIKLLYFTIYKTDYDTLGYFTKVITDPNELISEIRMTT